MFSLELASGSDVSGPLFLRIVEAVVRDIRRGRFEPGAALPSSRALSKRLGVHRNTVLRAYKELEAQGWIETERARGTYVAQSLPVQPEVVGCEKRDGLGYALRGKAPRRFASRLGLPAAWRSQGLLPLLGGLPDLRPAPRKELARAYRRALLRSESCLGYGDARGHRALREALAAHLSQNRGMALGPERLLITRGSQQGIYLVAKALLAPGDEVLVEALGYPPAWTALADAGAVLTPVGVDGEGLVVDEVARIAAERRIRALYLTPHHQYPTTATLSAPRRMALLGLAREHGFAIVEDDYDHEFHYDGRPVFPLAARDDGVIHVGTFSKVLAPGLRLGWVSAPEPVIDALAELRQMVDRQGDGALELAMAELLSDGELSRHVLRMRRTYHRRRDALAQMLGERFGDSLRFAVPPGGLALWAEAEQDTEAWAAAARERGVVVQSTAEFAMTGGPRRHLRIGFAALDEGELELAIQRLFESRPGKGLSRLRRG